MTASTTGDGITYSSCGNVSILTLDRPEKLNAMGARFWPRLCSLLEGFDADNDCRVVIITGRGSRAFSAGGDIASFEALSGPLEREAFQRSCMAAFQAVERCPIPVIAAVNGLALGGGCELAMASDIVIAADTAVFGLPEVQLGLVPGYGILRAAELVGRQWANWLIMAGERLNADEALKIGLVQKVVPADQLEKEALALASRLASLPREALAAAKRLVGNSATGDEDVARSITTVTALHGSVDSGTARRKFLAARAAVRHEETEG